MSESKTTVPIKWLGVERRWAIEEWIGEIQNFLEERIKGAPGELAANFARNLWDQTAEYDPDVG